MDAFKIAAGPRLAQRPGPPPFSSTSPAAPPCALLRSARCEQIRRETEVARASRERLEDERKARDDLPDVTRLPHQPLGSLKPTGAPSHRPARGPRHVEEHRAGRGARAVEAALRAGYTHVDCASVYENEQEVGDGMAEVFLNTKLNRRDVFITSKLWNDAHAPEDVEHACRASLARLRVSYLDLYLMHWPVASGNEKGTKSGGVEPPLLDTWQAMERLVDLGLVKHIGVSNFSVPKLRALAKRARHPVSVCQAECHPYWRNAALIEYCAENDIHFTAYSPLGSPDSAAMFAKARSERARGDERPGGDRRRRQNRQKRRAGYAALGAADAPDVFGVAQVVQPRAAAREPGRLRLGARGGGHKGDRRGTAAPRMVDGSFWLSADGPYKTLHDLWDE